MTGDFSSFVKNWILDRSSLNDSEIPELGLLRTTVCCFSLLWGMLPTTGRVDSRLISSSRSFLLKRKVRKIIINGTPAPAKSGIPEKISQQKDDSDLPF